jgi:hypothetical protein
LAHGILYSSIDLFPLALSMCSEGSAAAPCQHDTGAEDDEANLTVTVISQQHLGRRLQQQFSSIIDQTASGHLL